MKIPIYDVRLVKRRSLTIAEGYISDAERAARALHSLVGLTDREHVAVLFVNGSHGIVGAHIAAMGGQHELTIDPRPLLRAALLACASAMILGHNHPSGDPSPSAEDLAFTARMMRAGDTIGCRVVDHVIVTRDATRWHSMLNRGTLPVIE